MNFERSLRIAAPESYETLQRAVHRLTAVSEAARNISRKKTAFQAHTALNKELACQDWINLR